jgi:glucose-6-phosphate isomerase
MLPEAVPTHYDSHVVRCLSAMRGHYADPEAFEAALLERDRLVYEVYEVRRPEVAGELDYGVSIVHPGMVGDEFFMTKGHFHAVLETGELYYCLHGHGMMVMETPEGDWSVEELSPGRALYVPPGWAHRLVNVSHEQTLVSLFVYPGHAGHDYGTIERRGFRKLVVERQGRIEIVDNPCWRGAEHEDA